MGASFAESKPRETGYKQDDQNLLQKQVIISPRPAFGLTGSVESVRRVSAFQTNGLRSEMLLHSIFFLLSP